MLMLLLASFDFLLRFSILQIPFFRVDGLRDFPLIFWFKIFRVYACVWFRFHQSATKSNGSDEDDVDENNKSTTTMHKIITAKTNDWSCLCVQMCCIFVLSIFLLAATTLLCAGYEHTHLLVYLSTTGEREWDGEKMKRVRALTMYTLNYLFFLICRREFVQNDSICNCMCLCLGTFITWSNHTLAFFVIISFSFSNSYVCNRLRLVNFDSN